MKRRSRFNLSQGVIALVFLATFVVVACKFAGCAFLDRQLTLLKSSVKGLPMVIQTYDEDANVIDRVEGESIDLAPDDAFEIVNNDGDIVEKSAVLSITVGGSPMMHVGSSLIAYDSALRDIIQEYQQTVDIKNEDSSVPFINRIVTNFKNDFSPSSKVILIRSQNGTPLATFIGNEVSYQSTSIDKTTYFLVDGKPLFIYRCDYTVYELSLLK